MIRQNLNKRPEQIAREKYLSLGEDFENIRDWHFDNGFVISVPYLFAMGYFYEDDGLVCHLTYVGGDMDFLLRFNLFNIDFIEFQRNFSGKIKRYDYKKLTEKL